MLVKCEFYQSFGDSLSFDNEADNNAPALKISWLFFLPPIWRTRELLFLVS